MVYSVHHMKLNLKRIVRGVCIALLIWSAVVAGLIAFGTAKPPAAAAGIAGPFSNIDPRAVPALLRYKARDGALLSYREYPASGRHVAVLLHGSAGRRVARDSLAPALQHGGGTRFAPDPRGPRA